MIQYTALPDGSLKYKEPINIVTPLWRYRNGDKTYVEPVVPPCRVRRIELRTLTCGQKRATWHCDKFKRTVSVKECHECQVSESTTWIMDLQTTHTQETQTGQAESPSPTNT